MRSRLHAERGARGEARDCDIELLRLRRHERNARVQALCLSGFAPGAGVERASGPQRFGVQQISLGTGGPGGVDPRGRGPAYGDGGCVTMAGRDGRIRWRDCHLDRLLLGCGRLANPAPSRALLRDEIEAHSPRSESAVVKLIVTRGTGARGYAIPEPAEPVRILTIGPWPRFTADDYTRGIIVPRI